MENRVERKGEDGERPKGTRSWKKERVNEEKGRRRKEGRKKG